MRTTGIVGLPVHHSARPELLSLYSRITHSLQRFPESSAYRQGTLSLFNKRIAFIEKTEDLKKIEDEFHLGQMEELIEQAKEELKLISMMEANKFTGNNVNLVMIRDTLQERADKLNFDVPKRELQNFGWFCIREVVLEECQRMTDNVAAIYMMSDAVLSGNSFLTEENCAEHFQELQETLRSLETAILFSAIWIGHMNVNANGRFLNAFLNIIDSLNEMFYILKKSSWFHPEPKDNQYHFEQLPTTMARKFISGVNTLKYKLKNKPIKAKLCQPDIVRKNDFKAATKKFILSVDMFLNIITDADLLLSRRSQYKPAEEVQILQRLFEDLYHVSFRYNPYQQYQGREDPSTNAGPAGYYTRRKSVDSVRSASKSPSRRVSISDRVEYSDPVEYSSVRDYVQKIEKQLTMANAAPVGENKFSESNTILDKSRQVCDPEAIDSMATLNETIGKKFDLPVEYSVLARRLSQIDANSRKADE
ncbi:hypothetical protein HK103_002811 [Boothiomyces macroporosus]|uniref:Uncharacterized protein n=1 Tax=Boothiomyces macroporosus TaxID=261099 RepID=A0AAD5ULN0_9FUNG|nr:hypothetical protein HK103_002811 [Boothiomyces macroporosus]